MKTRFYILILIHLLVGILSAEAQYDRRSVDRFNLFIPGGEGSYGVFADVVGKLKDKRSQFKSDTYFLEHMFYFVHRKMLGSYEQYVPFSAIFTDEQKYDCVTGSILYALILEELDVKYEVKESDFHVYILAFLDDKEYLLETTDPLHGFAKSDEEIAFRKRQISEDAHRFNARITMEGLGADKVNMQQINIIDNSVNLIQLSGLHYYNQALDRFNRKEYRDALKLAEMAAKRYPSDRIMNAGSLIYSVAIGD